MKLVWKLRGKKNFHYSYLQHLDKKVTRSQRRESDFNHNNTYLGRREHHPNHTGNYKGLDYTISDILQLDMDEIKKELGFGRVSLG